MGLVMRGDIYSWGGGLFIALTCMSCVVLTLTSKIPIIVALDTKRNAYCCGYFGLLDDTKHPPPLEGTNYSL